MISIKDIEVKLPDKLKKKLYTTYDILALSQYFVKNYDFEMAWDIISLARNIEFDQTSLDDSTFNLLYDSILYNYFGHQYKYENEYTLYEPIRHYILDLIPNSLVCEHEIINKKKPDIFLKINNKLSVGEVKANYFTQKNIKQLRSYIDTYNVEIGYAFALKLTGKLDNDMIFIDITGIKDKYYRNVYNKNEN